MGGLWGVGGLEKGGNAPLRQQIHRDVNPTYLVFYLKTTGGSSINPPPPPPPLPTTTDNNTL